MCEGKGREGELDEVVSKVRVYCVWFYNVKEYWGVYGRVFSWKVIRLEVLRKRKDWRGVTLEERGWLGSC